MGSKLATLLLAVGSISPADVSRKVILTYRRLRQRWRKSNRSATTRRSPSLALLGSQRADYPKDLGARDLGVKTGDDVRAMLAVGVQGTATNRPDRGALIVAILRLLVVRFASLLTIYICSVLLIFTQQFSRKCFAAYGANLLPIG
jgi:hypothetical protein